MEVNSGYFFKAIPLNAFQTPTSTIDLPELQE